MTFKILKVDEFVVIKYFSDPYYEEEANEDSMIIEENDIDDLIDALNSYVEKRTG